MDFICLHEKLPFPLCGHRCSWDLGENVERASLIWNGNTHTQAMKKGIQAHLNPGKKVLRGRKLRGHLIQLTYFKDNELKLQEGRLTHAWGL